MSNYNAKNERIKRDYLQLLAEADQMSNATIDGVRKAINRLEQFTGFADFATFNKDQAIGFKKHLTVTRAIQSGKPISPATIVSTIKAIQAFFRWLAREPGYKSKVKASDIRYLNLRRKDIAAGRVQKIKKIPTLEQISTAIEAMPSETEIDLRNRALIAFTIVTGIRDKAMTTLRLKHIDLEELRVIQDPAEVDTKFSKPSTTTFFQVGPDLQQIVIDWIRFLRETKLYGHDDPVFPRTRVAPNSDLVLAAQGLEPVFWSSAGPVRDIFKVAFTAAGLPYFTPHSFRSTLAIFGERTCRTAEEMMAWSQNLSHQNMLTTFTSYGQVAPHRQCELIRNLGQTESTDDKIDRIAAMVERMDRISSAD